MLPPETVSTYVLIVYIISVKNFPYSLKITLTW